MGRFDSSFSQGEGPGDTPTTTPSYLVSPWACGHSSDVLHGQEMVFRSQEKPNVPTRTCLRLGQAIRGALEPLWRCGADVGHVAGSGSGAAGLAAPGAPPGPSRRASGSRLSPPPWGARLLGCGSCAGWSRSGFLLQERAAACAQPSSAAGETEAEQLTSVTAWMVVMPHWQGAAAWPPAQALCPYSHFCPSRAALMAGREAGATPRHNPQGDALGLGAPAQ